MPKAEPRQQTMAEWLDRVDRSRHLFSGVSGKDVEAAFDEARAERDAVAFLMEAPVVRVPHRPLLTRAWQLRDSITAYDATHIALAEQLDVPLLTCDARLGRAHGHDAEVVVYPRS
jgi:predicted nucleic acid-binding protein